MTVQRKQLEELLLARRSEATAQRAAQTLPEVVDLNRDRALLQKCGIDPNVLASLLYERGNIGSAGQRREQLVSRVPPRPASL